MALFTSIIAPKNELSKIPDIGIGILSLVMAGISLNYSLIIILVYNIGEIKLQVMETKVPNNLMSLLSNKDICEKGHFLGN